MVAIEAALALGERAKAEELVVRSRRFRPACGHRILDAQAQRFRARLAASDDGSRRALRGRGEAGFRELGILFWLAVTLLEHGELTGDTALARPRRARSSRA